MGPDFGTVPSIAHTEKRKMGFNMHYAVAMFAFARGHGVGMRGSGAAQ
jgi:hypothetical protein